MLPTYLQTYNFDKTISVRDENLYSLQGMWRSSQGCEDPHKDVMILARMWRSSQGCEDPRKDVKILEGKDRCEQVTIKPWGENKNSVY